MTTFQFNPTRFGSGEDDSARPGSEPIVFPSPALRKKKRDPEKKTLHSLRPPLALHHRRQEEEHQDGSAPRLGVREQRRVRTISLSPPSFQILDMCVFILSFSLLQDVRCDRGNGLLRDRRRHEAFRRLQYLHPRLLQDLQTVRSNPLCCVSLLGFPAWVFGSC